VFNGGKVIRSMFKLIVILDEMGRGGTRPNHIFFFRLNMADALTILFIFSC
jgi:hypothetical protein